jgi:hypothetical protein
MVLEETNIDKKQELINTFNYLLTELKDNKIDESDINKLWDVFYSTEQKVTNKEYTKYLFTGWWLYLMAQNKE